MADMIDLKKVINDFDQENIITQVILIGYSGKVKNIELEMQE